mmetsp:Transcript_106283/g.298999  ORF Transcript_106283/g.298999 Transcript_106283/m.298999 type:complete len:485 (-) Transcript_106283:179-1633(-)
MDLSKQQYAWESELESVDQKQANLSLMQWKLVRNQTGVLAQQLMEIKKQVEETTKLTEYLTDKVECIEAGNQTFEKEVKQFVGKLFEKVEANHGKLREDFEKAHAENQQRHTELADKVTTLSEDHSETKDVATALDQDVKMLQTDHSMQVKSHGTLREEMLTIGNEHKSALDLLMEHNRKVSEQVEEENRSRRSEHDALHLRCKELIDRERKGREDSQDKLFDHMGAIHTEMAACREELPVLRGKLSTTIDTLDRVENETVRQLHIQVAEFPQTLAALEGHIDQIAVTLSQETSARNSMAEVFDETIRTEHTNLVNMVTQKTTSLKLDVEKQQNNLQQTLETLQERFEKEVREWGDNVSSLHEKHDKEKSMVHERVSCVEGACLSNEQKFGTMTTDISDLDGRFRRMEETVASSSRKNFREIQALVAEERSAREAVVADFQDQFDWFGDTHDRLRELLIANAGQTRASSRPTSRATSRAASPMP